MKVYVVIITIPSKAWDMPDRKILGGVYIHRTTAESVGDRESRARYGDYEIYERFVDGWDTDAI